LKEAYKLLDCNLVDAQTLTDFPHLYHSLYFDDEGRINGQHETGFTYKGAPFVGSGLITGFLHDIGYETDVLCTLDEVHPFIGWLSPDDVTDLNAQEIEMIFKNPRQHTGKGYFETRA
jgi:hypothetical protein